MSVGKDVGVGVGVGQYVWDSSCRTVVVGLLLCGEVWVRVKVHVKALMRA